MKNGKFYFGLIAALAIIFITSCGTPVTLTGWKNPSVNVQVSKIVVMPLFEKLEYMQPFEQSVCAYFNSRGLPSIASLSFLNPSVKYNIADIKHKCDSLGADGILVFSYQGTDKSENYVPQTTYVTTDFGGYWGGGYWGGGYYGGYWGPGYYTAVSTGG